MKTIISYGQNNFCVQEMTKEQKEKLKKDKPEIYDMFFGEKPAAAKQ